MHVHFTGLTDRHLAAAVLAIHCYRSDYDGQFPGDLDDLIPHYLPVLPTDPMAPAGRTLGYRADPDAVLYSVGDDGSDNSASEEPIRPGNLPADPSYRRWQMRDAVVHLQRQARVRETDK